MIHILLAIAFSNLGLKVRVDGDGYLRFVRDGRAVYAKEAALQITDGKLTDAAGDPVLPSIQIGAEATLLETDLEGNIFATYQGKRTKAGQLVLATFPASEAFQAEDVILKADDRPKLGNPGDDTLGVIRVVAGFDVTTPKITIKPPTDKPQPAKPQPQNKQADTQNPNPPMVIPDELANQFLARANSPKPKPATKPLVVGTGLQITVQEHSVVEGDKILLGQVAQVDGDPALVAKASAIELGDTPPTGIKRIIDRSRILGRLRMNGFKPEDVNLSVPEAAEVRRKGQMIPNSQFVVTAIKALMDKGGISGTWESTDNFADLEVPSGKLELRAEQMVGEDTGNASVVIAIYVEGSRFNSRTVHLHLKDNVPPVQPGSAVKVIMTAGSAQVEIPGIARSMGRVGQAIQVEVQAGNPPVKTFHTGIVTGPGTVEVKL